MENCFDNADAEDGTEDTETLSSGLRLLWDREDNGLSAG